jgi:hypothetical protein
MSKIRRISDFQHSFSFATQEEQFEEFFERFLKSDLGRIHTAVPWDGAVSALGLTEAKKGPTAIFGPRGKLALMFLKHWSGSSDRRLFEQLNGNLEWQLFCGIYLGRERLTNYKIVSEIRCELAGKLDIDGLQKAFFAHWSPHMADLHSIVMDATCYESEVRYPTNEKLLWECVDWSHRQMKAICRAVGEKVPRTKYLKWKRRYISYSKMRRKTKSKRKSLDRSLLWLLEKIDVELDRLEERHKLQMPDRYTGRRETIKRIFAQQHQIFHTGERPNGRIVSTHKDYLRPIVRGKEIKKVEFGAKVNKFQINGISFIEHLSFDAFNEGTRFRDTVFAAQLLTRTKTRLAGADAIYATNKNRTFATSNEIRTDFKKKGRAGRHGKQRRRLAAAITKERASRLEGSFGKDKEHYHLKKVKARTKATETLWIFFGIHTGNALEIGRRMAAARQKAA